MQIYQGKSVFSGIAIGKIRVYKKNERQVKRVKVENPDAEMARFEEAKAKGIAQLGVLYEKACKEVGEANAAIFEVHQMMMEDDGYNESVENIIKSQGVNAEYAVATTGDNFAQMFSAMDDDYMRIQVLSHMFFPIERSMMKSTSLSACLQKLRNIVLMKSRAASVLSVVSILSMKKCKEIISCHGRRVAVL